MIAEGNVLLHPHVMGELLLGGLPWESEAAAKLLELPAPPIASVQEVNAFITWARLVGTGVGYVDCHLLVSARLLSKGRVLTRDQKLSRQAKRLGVAYEP